MPGELLTVSAAWSRIDVWLRTHRNVFGFRRVDQMKVVP